MEDRTAEGEVRERLLLSVVPWSERSVGVTAPAGLVRSIVTASPRHQSYRPAFTSEPHGPITGARRAHYTDRVNEYKSRQRLRVPG